MTDWGLIAIRFALYADLMLLVGLAAFPLYSLTRSEREDGTILPLGGKLVWLAVAALPLSAAGFAISSAAMMGVPVTALDFPMLASMASETEQGAAWIVRIVALVSAMTALVVLRRSQTARYAAALIGGAIALATLLWSGHAAATEGALGTAHRIIDIVHMIAAALWIGGIAALSLLLARPVQSIYNVHISSHSLTSFSRIGMVIVAIVALTGLFNSYAISGPDPTILLQSVHGQLLTAKIALFGAMLLLAAYNRYRLVPHLQTAVRAGSTAAAIAALRLSLFAEVSAALAILILVAWLGTLELF